MPGAANPKRLSAHLTFRILANLAECAVSFAPRRWCGWGKIYGVGRAAPGAPERPPGQSTQDRPGRGTQNRPGRGTQDRPGQGTGEDRGTGTGGPRGAGRPVPRTADRRAGRG
ncbi:hypothetical protein Acy02nite_12090 [Actinoplanes cyaneus]|uniref:Uncharacterized protein n=1 Tax=Actinoplanes cyaneus TaxID=52696 RepID=A0A919IH26_9ACTN|nr:hypothetical protein Acy02nite_12090 [Actinoplanes cyaneus]